MTIRSQTLPLEPSWLRAANEKLDTHYRKKTAETSVQAVETEPTLNTPSNEKPNLAGEAQHSANAQEIESIDRFLETDFQDRFFEALGHRHVVELRRILHEGKSGHHRSKSEFHDFLSVVYSTANRWGHDQNLAGGQYYFAIHCLDLDCEPGTLKFPSTARMRRLSAVSFMRHVRYKYLNDRTKSNLSEIVLDHLVNLMTIMNAKSDFVYNPYAQPPKNNMRAIVEYANQLFKQRYPKHAYTSQEILKRKTDIEIEVKRWLDEWGLAYALLASGYRNEWYPA